MRAPEPGLLTYSHGGGHTALCAALAHYLRVARSVRCDANQILITEGVHQAIDMTLRILATKCGSSTAGGADSAVPRASVFAHQVSNAGLHLVLRLPDDCDEVAIIARGRADAGSVAQLLARRRAARLAAWYVCVQDDDIKPAFHKLRVCRFLCVRSNGTCLYCRPTSRFDEFSWMIP